MDMSWKEVCLVGAIDHRRFLTLKNRRGVPNDYCWALCNKYFDFRVLEAKFDEVRTF